MNDLISREVAIETLRERAECYTVSMFSTSDDCKLARYITLEATEEIKAIPIVDAEPIRHGEWGDLCNGKVRVCSYCKHNFDNTCNDIDGEWMFCPHCGTTMDTKSEEAQNNA